MPLSTIHSHHQTKWRDRSQSIALWLIVLLLLLLFLHEHGMAQGIKPTGNNVSHVICDSGCSGSGGGSAITSWGGGTLGAMAAYGTSPGAVLVPGMNAFITNVPHIVCDSGCGGAASFLDNSAFTVGATPVNILAGYYTSGAAPALTSGNAARLRMDVNSYLLIDCVTGCFQTTQPVSIASMPSTPVTGTFWQATQPVSGTFWQATQPVSIASMPSTPVTGTFWQATQPVSIASMPSTPVTGTFFQATQPVSGTVTANQGTSPWVTSATLAAETTKVIGTVRNVGNGGATLDAAPAAALPTNAQLIAGRDSTQTGGGTAVPVVCDKSAFITPSTATTTQIVALSGSTVIYVCSYSVSFLGSATANTGIFKYGTGTACATGTTSLSATMQGPTATGSGTVITRGSGVGYLMKTIAANALCFTTSGAIAVGVDVTYAQF